MTEGKLLVVKAGTAVSALRSRRGDFEDWIRDGMRLAASDVRVVAVCEGEALPDPVGIRGVVVTGSPAFVSEREPWSVDAEAWLRPVVSGGLPVLGICYGHQLLGQALGGRVGPNPQGREMGTVSVDLGEARRVGDALLGDLPARVTVQATHVESVLRPPEGAIRLASNAADPNHALRYGRRAWGVQFHPEFDADIMGVYLEERAEVLRAEGFDPHRLERETRDSPDGFSLLRRFGEILREG